MVSVIITGGTRGIGRAISTKLINEGYHIYAIYRNRHEEAQKFSEQFDSINISLHQVDISNRDEVSDFFNKIRMSSIETIALVNNAGIYHVPQKKNEEDVFKSNVLGTHYMTNAFAEYRRAGNFIDIGAVVNIGSTTGMHGPTGSEIYAASKSAMHRLISVQAYKFAKENILHINTIAPGPVPTELLLSVPASQGIDKMTAQTPTGRLTKPEEIAVLAYFLIKNRNLNIVGAEISIDGGRILGF
ncbi:SDR family oxidoreductase [Candidatus Pacearchaeota archaeon]|nr:SDR family oxidoreductase [Candidatus Pacearchaeota archaeon]